jgi:hypothetical protein
MENKKCMNLTKEQVFEIAKLATGRELNFDDFKAEHVTHDISKLSEEELERYIIMNDVTREQIEKKGFQEIVVKIPIGDKDDLFSFYLHIYSDGYVKYENGSDVSMRYSNPIKIAKILIEAGYPLW